MKCPKCSFVQADGGTECKSCGVIFEKVKQTAVTGSPAGAEESSASKARYYAGAAAVAVALFWLVRGPDGAEQRAVRGDPPAQSRFDDIERPARDSKFQRELAKKSGLTQLCRQSLAESGATEDEILVHCEDDPDAKKRIAAAGAAYAESLNSIPVGDVVRMEVLAGKSALTIGPDEAALEVYLVLYDSRGQMASTEGEVKLEYQPDSTGLTETRIYPSHFRIGAIPTTGETGTYLPLTSARFVPRPTGPVSITVELDGRLKAGASFSFP